MTTTPNQPIKLSKADLLVHLKEQMGFLTRSCAAYDIGYRDEAKRIAVVLRVLFHDTKTSKSLLGQLGIKQSMALLNSALPIISGNLISHAGLTMMQLGGGTGEFVPRLNENPTGRPLKKLFFQDWWNATVVIDQQKNQFTRRELVLAVTNKDGGAHIDPNLDAAYAALTRDNTMGWIFSSGEKHEPMLPIELASIRQVGHEALTTLKQKMPELF